ncbi:21772_t:CDS:2 [Rhizophagus irregularis]|nr:21772_t:CDS:2 [Rhizophagus irregularis]
MIGDKCISPDVKNLKYALTEVETSMSLLASAIAFKVKQVSATEVIVSIESWVQTSEMEHWQNQAWQYHETTE